MALKQLIRRKLMIPIVVTVVTIWLPNDFSTWQDAILIFLGAFFINFIADTALGKYND